MLNSLILPPLFRKMKTAFLKKGLIGVMYVFTHFCLCKIIRVLTWRQNNGVHDSITTVYIRRKISEKKQGENICCSVHTLNSCIFSCKAYEEEKV